MQIGNYYSVHKSSYGFCTDWGEFKTLEEANDCFYKLVREELEKKDPDHKHKFHIYMLYWNADYSHHTMVKQWGMEEGYMIDFPKKPKSKFKILKQLYIRRKVLRLRSKCLMCSDCVRAFCKSTPRYCYGPHNW